MILPLHLSISPSPSMAVSQSDSLPTMESCTICTKTVRPRIATREHKRKTGHGVCPTCGKILGSVSIYQDHVAFAHKEKCPTCPASFRNQEALAEHQRKVGHCACGDCGQVFGSRTALAAHLESQQHSTDFGCCDCDVSFRNFDALRQHLKTAVHKRKAKKDSNEAESRPKCEVCGRSFKNAKALKNHCSSLKHKPPRKPASKPVPKPLGKIACIAESSCRKRFSSPSALLQHLESGSCPSGMDVEKLRDIIIAHDTDRLITSPPTSHISQLLLEANNRLALSSSKNDSASDMNTGSSDTESDDGVFIQTPSHASVPSSFVDGTRTPTYGSTKEWAMIVSETSGQSGHCPFCPPDRRPFASQTALQDHLRSPAHAEPFLFCPATLMPGAAAEGKVMRAFKNAGALAQHLESGKCAGGIKVFWEALDYLEKRLRTLGFSFTTTAIETSSS